MSNVGPSANRARVDGHTEKMALAVTFWGNSRTAREGCGAGNAARKAHLKVGST